MALRMTSGGRLIGKARAGAAVALMCILLSGLSTTPAQAELSAGASQKCDSQGHCVVGGAFSVNAGNNALLIPGKAIAGCTGSGNGALNINIECTIAGATTELSFPGTYGAVPVVVDAYSGVLKVCWKVTGTFFNPMGPASDVTTRGCALVAV
jgi:hypothetical protein